LERFDAGGERVSVGGARPSRTADLLAPERHLFLSPHYDDVALSCGGTATLVRRGGRRAEVALLFGSEPDPDQPLTAFAQEMHDDWGLDPAGVIAGRRAEEACAAAILGSEVRFLPFHDAIYRGDSYLNDGDLFGMPVAAETDLPAALVAALGLPAMPDGATRLYVPLAIGGHVDHRHAFAAGVGLDRAGWEVWFYEDLPYALKPGKREARLAGVGERLEVAALVEIGGSWEEKIAAILCYRSQLARTFRYANVGGSREEIEALLRRDALAAGEGTPVERFWRLE
jgi:LmbE family N-acetylglucosaminyl deacetylase